MHTVFALLCFVVVIHWLIFPYPPGLLHWHCGNLTIAPVPAKQPWWIWISTTCEISMNDYITTTKQNTTKPCAYFLGYTVRTRPFPTANQTSPPKLTQVYDDIDNRKIQICCIESRMNNNIIIRMGYNYSPMLLRQRFVNHHSSYGIIE